MRLKLRAYVNNTLVHWTGRGQTNSDALSALTSICDEKLLRLSYCPNYVSEGYDKKSAMVCFTDIPLWHAKEHCRIFGKFGIGFKKEKMIAYGANPALYTTGEHFSRIKKLSELLERMEDLEKDRESREEVEPYNFTEDETVAFQEVTDLLQEYSYKGQDHSEYVTYYQKEWRLTFRSLPFAGGNKLQEPGMRCFYCRDGKNYSTVKFSTDDVDYIVVPARYWLKGRKLANKIGCKLRVYELSVFI
jgi:hypothetical protein